MIVGDEGSVCHKEIIDIENIVGNVALVDNMVISGQPVQKS